MDNQQAWNDVNRELGTIAQHLKSIDGRLSAAAKSDDQLHKEHGDLRERITAVETRNATIMNGIKAIGVLVGIVSAIGAFIVGKA